jgi:hypothetical protein
MFVSLMGYAVEIRPLRVYVPAFADSYLPAVTVSLKAGLYTYNPVERTRHKPRTAQFWRSASQANPTPKGVRNADQTRGSRPAQ